MDHDAATPTQAVAETSRFPLAIRSQRVLQVTLGLFWILDAALQFQPFMFGRGFVDTFILNNAAGQPFVLGDLITHVGNFVAPDIAVWNTFFALIQLFIGVGLLFRRTVRPALAVLLRVGPGHLGRRRGHGDDPHRHRHRAHRRAGLGAAVRAAWASWPGRGRPGATSTGATGPSASPRRRRPRASDAPSRRWRCGRGTGRSRPCCSSSPTTGPARRSRAPSSAWPPGSRAGSPTSSRPWATSSRRPAPRRRGCWPPSRSSSASGRWWPAARGGSSLAGALFSLLLWIAGQGLIGNIFTSSVTDPNTRAARRRAGGRHGPHGPGARREWRPPAAELVRRAPGGRGPRRGRARCRAGAERQLPGAGRGVDRLAPWRAW